MNEIADQVQQHIEASRGTPYDRAMTRYQEATIRIAEMETGIAADDRMIDDLEEQLAERRKARANKTAHREWQERRKIAAARVIHTGVAYKRAEEDYALSTDLDPEPIAEA